MRSSRPEPRSGLPAPYEDPWRRLGADLRDVIASSGLRLREIWRRNGEGDLPRPPFWPASLAALFWPLLLALLLVLVAVPVLLWFNRGPRPTKPAPESAGTVAVQPAAPPGPATEPAADPAAGPSSPKTGRPEGEGQPAEIPGAPQPPASSGEIPRLPTKAGAEVRREDAAPSGAAANPEAELRAEPPPCPDDQLLKELLGQALPAWVLGVEKVPAEGLLRLRLGRDYLALPERQRRSLADDWQGRSAALGYEHLELVDAGGRLLGRVARVGSGMILLDPPSSSR